MNRLAAAAGALDVVGDELAGGSGDGRSVRWPHALGRRRRRDAQIGEAREQQRDRLRLGRLVDSVERLAPAAGEQLGDELVRADHQLLDQHVCVWLGLAPRALDPALAVEGEDDLGALDAQCPAREALVAQLLRQPFGAPQRLGQFWLGPLAAGEDRLGLAVGQPRAAADHRAVEGRLAAVQRELDGDAEPVDVRPQRAELLGQFGRQHRRDEARHVDREGSLGGASVERRGRADEPRDVRNVHERAVLLDGQRVVEVLGRVGVDREREPIAQVDPTFRVDRRWIVGLEAAQLPLLDQQPFQHDLDRARRPKHALDPRATAALAHDGQVARPALGAAVEQQRRARHEIRLADEVLAPRGELDDN